MDIDTISLFLTIINIPLSLVLAFVTLYYTRKGYLIQEEMRKEDNKNKITHLEMLKADNKNKIAQG